MKYVVPIVALMIGSCWLGFGIASIYISAFAYKPCWNSLIDVRSEAMHQKNLGDEGWNYQDPDLMYNCVRVSGKWRYKGYKGK